MSQNYLKLDITYQMNGKYSAEGNVEGERRNEMIAEFLQTQIGAGKDLRQEAMRETYKITLEWDLGTDNFKVNDDIGNDSMRDGILTVVLGQLERAL